VFALFALEVEAEGGFEGSLDGREGGEVAVFDAGLGFAGVGGQEAGDILRSLEGGVMGQNALKIFFENGPQLHRHFLGVDDDRAEGFFVGGQLAAFEDDGIAVVVGLDKGKGAQIGDKHQAVAAEIFGDLFAFHQRLEVMRGRLDFHDAAGGYQLRRGGLAIRGFAELVGGIKAAVGNACSSIGGIDDAGHLGLERAPDRGE
jgi:hypothetical protein